MRILAIETATWRASVALVEGPNAVAERHKVTRGEHAAHVLPMIDEMFAQTGWTPRCLDAVAVSIGPGSFTGLRVGLSLAKALAYALNLPIVPVPTLRALAAAAPVDHGRVAAVLDAHRGELYAAVFRREGLTCTAEGEEWLLPADALCERLQLPITLIGDASERYGKFFAERLGEEARILPFPEYGPCAIAVGRLAQELGPGQAPETLEPHYVRPSEAEEKRRRQQQRGSEETTTTVV